MHENLFNHKEADPTPFSICACVIPQDKLCTPFLFEQLETTNMKTFIIFLSLLVIAAAQRPETPCLYGKPEGYGQCHMFLSCGKNEECIGNICCRVIGKPVENERP
uniref:Uncharacterized protein n=1 Tax=Magallana gigas TaxID=29159 RepID=A0A8W8KLS9_MAGGI